MQVELPAVWKPCPSGHFGSSGNTWRNRGANLGQLRMPTLSKESAASERVPAPTPLKSATDRASGLALEPGQFLKNGEIRRIAARIET